MRKAGLLLLLLFVSGQILFTTWMLFAGNLAAAFSTFPFLLISYLFVLRLKSTRSSVPPEEGPES